MKKLRGYTPKVKCGDFPDCPDKPDESVKECKGCPYFKRKKNV